MQCPHCKKEVVAPAPHVLIEIAGGVLTDVFSDQPITYKLKDWDNIKEGDASTFLAGVDDPTEWDNPDVVFKSFEELVEQAKDEVDEYLDVEDEDDDDEDFDDDDDFDDFDDDDE